MPGMLDAYRVLRRGQAIARRWRKSPVPSEVDDGGFAITVPGYSQCWAGYYDHSPFRPGFEDVLVVHAVNRPAWRRPSPRVPVAIVLVERESARVVARLGESTAWNWQQGARALWLSADAVIYNVYDGIDDAYRSVVVDVRTGDREVLPLPVQETDARGRIYSISYEALSRIRPDYGYRNRPCTDGDIRDAEIVRYDPSTGERRTVVRVADLVAETQRRHQSTISRPKVNHVTASPDSAAFLFVFRYFLAEKRVTDLYVADAESGACRRIADDCEASHYCWLDEITFLVTMRGDSGFGYYLLDARAGTTRLFRRGSDGHPQPLGRHRIVTDTYPDELALRYLLAVSLRDPSRSVVLGAYAEPLLLMGETRCDLHPSVSDSGRWIQIDCTSGGRRQVRILPAPEETRRETAERAAVLSSQP